MGTWAFSQLKKKKMYPSIGEQAKPFKELRTRTELRDLGVLVFS